MGKKKELDLPDPSEIIRKFGKNLELVKVAKIQDYIDSQSSRKFGVAGRALLLKSVGNWFLEHGNPPKAVNFLEQCIKLYYEIKTQSEDGEENYADAQVLLALSWVRNYEKIGDAERLLIDVIDLYAEYDMETASLKCLTSYANANLGMAELILFHKRKEAERASQFIWAASDAIEDAMLRDPNLYDVLNFEMLIAFYNYFMVVDNYGKASGYADNIEMLMRYHYNQSEDSYCHWRASVALLRYGDFTFIDKFRICNVLRNALKPGDHYDCIMGMVHYVLGLDCFNRNDFTIGDEYLSSCCQTFEIALGENNLLTAEANFHLGLLLNKNDNRPSGLQSLANERMLKSLKIMEKNPVKVRSYSFLLFLYAVSLYPYGKHNKALKYYQKAIDANINAWGDKTHHSLADYVFDFGRSHFLHQSWELANAQFIKVRRIVEKLKDRSGAPKHALEMHQVFLFSGYCYFKLGDDKNAREMFHLCEQYLEENTESSFEVIDRLVRSAEFYYSGLGQIGKAQKLFETAVKLLKRINIGENSGPKVAYIHFLLGFYYENLEKCDQLARKFYNQSLTFGKTFPDAQDPAFCDGMLALARLDLKDGRIKECEAKLNEGLRRALQTFDSNDINLKPFFDTFGSISVKEKSIEDETYSFFSYQKKLRNIRGVEKSEFFVSFCFNFALRLYNDSPDEGRKPHCFDLIRQSFEDFKKILGRQNQKTAESERMLGLCYLKYGDLMKGEWHLFNSALTLTQS